MKIFFHCLSFCFCLITVSTATAQTTPSVIWQKTIGGSDIDSVSAVSIGSDNTFVLCGSSKSKKSGTKSDNNVGGFDYWVVKMDLLGNIIWNKTFGGTKDDVASAIIATSDGGYLVGGSSISDKSATKSDVSFKSSNDYWVLKLDANGNKLWDKTLGGIFTEKLTSLTELPGGKYAMGGYSYSDITGTKTAENIGLPNTCDYWVLVLGSDGTLLTQSTLGGTSIDKMAGIAPAGTNGMYIAGHSYSLRYTGYKSQLPAGNNDFWIVRSDINGVKQSELGFGGSRSDYLTSMQVLPDTSLILGGYSNSPVSGTKSESFLGVTDYWLVKTNPDGTKKWDRTIGGALGDYLMSVQQTKDKGFILGGYSNSNTGNNKTENSRGGNDFWIVKLDSSGNVMWDKTIGGSGDDRLAGVYQTDSNKYILAGTSRSGISGDKDAENIGASGDADFWILSLTDASVLPVTLLSFTNNIQKQHVVLNWTVTNQINTDHFEIQRSTDGRTFYQSGVVAAVETSGTKTYQFIDQNALLLPADQIYYRLKIINNDGTFTYSNVLTVQLVLPAANDFQVLPNPVKNTLTIRYNIATAASINLVMYSATGRAVLKATLPPSTTATGTHSFNVAGLAPGIYKVVLYTDKTKGKITKTIIKE